MDLSTSTLVLTDLQDRVLRALADPGTPPLGTAIARAAGIQTSVYVVLRRLEDFGLAREDWATEPVRDAAGKGHRRIYTLTTEGAAYLASH